LRLIEIRANQGGIELDYKFNHLRFSKILVNLSAIATLLLFTSFSCSKKLEPEPQPYTIFIILAPIGNSQQIDLADKFLTYAEDYLLFPGFSYEIQGICQHGLESIASPQYLQSSSKDAIITQQTKDWIAQSFDKSSNSMKLKCTERVESLSKVINTLNDYLRQNPNRQIFVFGQIPWDEISDKTYTQLESEVKKIEKKEQVKKIYLFGRSKTAGFKIVDIFKQFGSTVVKSESDGTTEVENMVSNAQKEIEGTMKQRNK